MTFVRPCWEILKANGALVSSIGSYLELLQVDVFDYYDQTKCFCMRTHAL